MEPGTVCWEQSADRRAYCYMWELAVTSVENESNLFWCEMHTELTHFPQSYIHLLCEWQESNTATPQELWKQLTSELRKGTVQPKAYARSLCHCEHLYLRTDVVKLAIISEVCKANASELRKGTVQPKLAPMLSKKGDSVYSKIKRCYSFTNGWEIVLKWYKNE